MKSLYDYSKEFCLLMGRYKKMLLQEMRQAWVRFLTKFLWHHFITLHPDIPVTPQTLEKMLKEFTLRVNNKVYGKRNKGKLNWFVVTEYEKGWLHAHIIAGGFLKGMTSEELREHMRAIWADIKYARKPLEHNEWFEPVDEILGLGTYVTKCFSSRETCVDIFSCHFEQVTLPEKYK